MYYFLSPSPVPSPHTTLRIRCSTDHGCVGKLYPQSEWLLQMFLCQWLDVADSCVFGNFKCAAIVAKPFTPGLFCVCQYGAKELSHLSGQIMGRWVTAAFLCTSPLLLWNHFASKTVAPALGRTAFQPHPCLGKLPNTGRKNDVGCNPGICRLAPFWPW